MASITPRKDKSGNIISYTIRVFRGYDSDGNKLKPYTMTYKPDKKLTARQVEKELNKQAVQFEEQCKLGYALDTRQTFAEYAQYVIELKERSGTKHSTIRIYKDLLKRINQGIGHIKIGDIRPQHLNNLYAQLSKPGLRDEPGKAVAKVDIAALIRKNGYTFKSFAEKAGIAENTTAKAAHGETIAEEIAVKIAATLSMDIHRLFNVTRNMEPLSNKTIVEHHRFISVVLGQAEKECLIMYNPAESTDQRGELF